MDVKTRIPKLTTTLAYDRYMAGQKLVSSVDRPWRHLERLVEDVQVRELAFGSGYVMTGRRPA